MVHQNHGERNFHIFYQLLESGDSSLLTRLGLDMTNPQHYRYLVKVCVFQNAMNYCCYFSFCSYYILSLALALALLHQGNCPRVSTISDKSSWKAVSKGLTVIGFNEEEVEVRRLHADYNHTHSHSRPNTTRAHEPPTSCCFPLLPQELLKVVASVLHLGNTLFGEDEYGQTHFTTETPLTYLTEVRTTITISALIPQLDVKT